MVLLPFKDKLWTKDDLSDNYNQFLLGTLMWINIYKWKKIVLDSEHTEIYSTGKTNKRSDRCINQGLTYSFNILCFTLIAPAPFIIFFHGLMYKVTKRTLGSKTHLGTGCYPGSETVYVSYIHIIVVYWNEMKCVPRKGAYQLFVYIGIDR